jgi:putative Holliday junction resolvase
MGRVMAVDPGDVRIGLAVSDPSGTIARPLKVIRYRSRVMATKTILQEAESLDVECIVVGVAYDLDGMEGPQARKSLRLVASLSEQTSIPVKTWDESDSSLRAQEHMKKTNELDAFAAAFILQEYLDAQQR